MAEFAVQAGPLPWSPFSHLFKKYWAKVLEIPQ